MKNTRSLKALSVILMLAMLMLSFPISAHAEDAATEATVVEVESMREEYTKHFLMPDGSYTAVVYSAPVHRKDEIGNLATSKIFSCITHGSQTSIATSSTVLAKATIDSLDASAFNNLELVCLGSCYTGQGGSGAANLANAFYSKGVDAVVSFTGLVVNVQAIAWTRGFMSAIASGSTIAEAIIAGDEAEDSDPFCKLLASETTTEEHRYFVGNGSIRPCE